MEDIKKFFGGLGTKLWENKGGIAGLAVGGAIGSMLFPGGGIMSMIIGAILGGIVTSMFADDGDSLVNQMLNRKQETRGSGQGRDRTPYVYKQEDRIQIKHKEIDGVNAVLSGVQSNDNKTFTVNSITVSAGAKVNFSDPVTLKLDANGNIDTKDKGVQDFAQRLEKLSVNVRQAGSDNSPGANSFTKQEINSMQSAASNLGGYLNQTDLATYNRYADNGKVDTKAMFAGVPDEKLAEIAGHGFSPSATPPRAIVDENGMGGSSSRNRGRTGHPAGKGA